MTPSEPRRAMVGAAIVAIPLALFSGGLLCTGEETAAWGVYAFIALPFASALVAAWYVHGIHAFMIAGLLSALAFLLVGYLCDCLPGLLLLIPTLGGSLAVGAILGPLVRAIARRSYP